MFDDEKDEQNWDDVSPSPQTGSDEPSWDEILSNENMADLSIPTDNNEDLVIDFGDENAAVNNIDNFSQTNMSEEDLKPNASLDEPVIETTSSKHQNQEISDLYETGENEPQDVQDSQPNLMDSDEGEISTLQSQSEIPNDDAMATKKTPGIKQDTKSFVPVILGVLVAIVLIVFAVGLFMGSSKSKTPLGEEQMTELPQQEGLSEGIQDETSMPQDQTMEGQDSMGTQDLTGGNQIQGQDQEKKVVVDVVNTGRNNPFAPTGNFSNAGYTLPKGLDILAPPQLKEGMPPNKLVDIVVSGILYDNAKPSAIITVGGVDHFVQKGDAIDEYIVSYIAPTQVTIRSGRNTFTASIGQQFNVNDRIEGQTTYVKSKTGVTRQYFSPSSVDVESKEENNNNDNKDLQ